MEEELSFSNALGLRLAGVLARPVAAPAAPVVVCCHGFASGKDSQTNVLLARQLERRGIASFRFDFTGHDDSEGETAQVTVSQGVDDLRSAIERLNQDPGIAPKVGLFGESYGGNVVLWYAAQHGGVQAIAVQAPVSDYAAVKRKKLGPEGIARWRADGYILEDDEGRPRLDYHFYEDAAAHDTYELARQIDADCLIVHGAEDDTVPLQQSQALAAALGPRARLRVVFGASHGFDNPGEREGAVAEAARFFETHLLSSR
jgi:pimeloyl-ACP methyl ester carboxylesterase